MAPEGVVLKTNFTEKISRTAFVGGALQHGLQPCAWRKQPSVGTQTIVPLTSYCAPLVPQQEQTPVSRTVAKILSRKDLREIWLQMPTRVLKFSVLGNCGFYLVRHRHRRDPKKGT